MSEHISVWRMSFVNRVKFRQVQKTGRNSRIRAHRRSCKEIKVDDAFKYNGQRHRCIAGWELSTLCPRKWDPSIPYVFHREPEFVIIYGRIIGDQNILCYISVKHSNAQHDWLCWNYNCGDETCASYVFG